VEIKSIVGSVSSTLSTTRSSRHQCAIVEDEAIPQSAKVSVSIASLSGDWEVEVDDGSIWSAWVKERPNDGGALTGEVGVASQVETSPVRDDCLREDLFFWCQWSEAQRISKDNWQL